jgi:hypothetical protein
MRLTVWERPQGAANRRILCRHSGVRWNDDNQIVRDDLQPPGIRFRSVAVAAEVALEDVVCVLECP